MKEEEIDLSLKVMFLIVILIGFLVSFYLGGMWLDWQNDKNICKAEIKQWLSETDHHISCYANEDFSHYNFGKNILCSCFWRDINFRSNNRDFLSGTLK